MKEKNRKKKENVKSCMSQNTKACVGRERRKWERNVVKV
jgi:hypothetical protein